MSIRIKSNNGFFRGPSRKDLGLGLVIGRGIFKASESVKSQSQLNIQRGSRSGQFYKRGGKTARRSAAGEFPKTDRGILVSSIFNKRKDPLTYFIGTRLKYGRYLEFGTNRMGARPWLRPTFNRLKPSIVKSIIKSIKDVVRKL